MEQQIFENAALPCKFEIKISKIKLKTSPVKQGIRKLSHKLQEKNNKMISKIHILRKEKLHLITSLLAWTTHSPNDPAWIHGHQHINHRHPNTGTETPFPQRCREIKLDDTS